MRHPRKKNGDRIRTKRFDGPQEAMAKRWMLTETPYHAFATPRSGIGTCLRAGPRVHFPRRCRRSWCRTRRSASCIPKFGKDGS